MLNTQHQRILQARGFSIDTLLRFGLASGAGPGDGGAVRIPYLVDDAVVATQRRWWDGNGAKSFDWVPDSEMVWWNRDILKDPNLQSGDQPLVITEGVLDALAAIEAGHECSVSVPCGAPGKSKDVGTVLDGIPDDEKGTGQYKFWWRDRDLTDRIRRFVIAVDNDTQGQKLAIELVKRLGPERCKFVTYPDGCKDLNDVLRKRGSSSVMRVISTAKPWPVNGLFRLDEFPSVPKPSGKRTGFVELDKHFLVVPETLTVLTGPPNHGKSTWLEHFVAKQIKAGRSVCLGSFETPIKPHLRDQMRKAIISAPYKDFTKERVAEADALIQKKLSFIGLDPKRDDEPLNLKQVLELARIAVLRDDCEIVILDPWNEISQLRSPTESETDYIGRALQTMKSFARSLGVSMVVVAHPSKPSKDKKGPPNGYDISGSAHWMNKPDYILSYYRADRMNGRGALEIQKVRNWLPGKIGTVDFRLRDGALEALSEVESDILAGEVE